MSGYIEKNGSIGELVRKSQDDYIRGNVTISEYVIFDMYDTINTIEAYLNSKHTSGEFDALEREKPFFNIVVAASNIWFRATDIDRKNIRVKATKQKDIIDAFLATVFIQDWMRREKIGQFLNEWGRVLSRYGSASVKFVEKDGRLIPSVSSWNRMIVDQIDYTNNPKIEVMELSEGQLRKRKEYDQDVIQSLCDARKARTLLRGRNKDNKSDYIKLYEVHGELPLSWKTGKEIDKDTYVQQMFVVAFEAVDRKKDEYDDYILFAGREEKEPNMITHLIKEDGRTLAIGSVEHLFQSQWMENHNKKSIKDQLDIASKLIFQTSDVNFVGQNALTAIETGDILIHGDGKPLTAVANNSHDVSALQSFGQEWKALGNEINGISESMLGQTAPSGTAWRQVDALLQESHSLFELMTENKGLAIEEMFREYVIPFIKKKLNHSKEIAATLEANDIDWVDSKYIKNYSIKMANDFIKKKILAGQTVTQEEQAALTAQIQGTLKDHLNSNGNQRFFKPSEIKDKTWKEQFKDLEFELEVDVTGENVDYKTDLATLNTALQVVMNPMYSQSPQAQMIVGEILRLSSGLSPLQLAQVKAQPIPPPQITPTASGGGSIPMNGGVPTLTK